MGIQYGVAYCMGYSIGMKHGDTVWGSLLYGI